MKLIDESDISSKLKEKICFIDLPGFGTNNFFEKKNKYSNLILSFENFIFVVSNMIIRENDNEKFLNYLYNKINHNIFFNNSLFIFNIDKNFDYTEKNISYGKNEITKIFKKFDSKTINDINICLFNAKYYENYLLKFNYYKSLNNLLDYEYYKYINSKEKKWIGEIGRFSRGTFSKYLIEQLKSNIRNDIPIKFTEEKIKSNKHFENEIKKIIENKNYSLKEKEQKQIINYFSFANDNINKSDLLNKSNIEFFKNKLLNWIEGIIFIKNVDFDLKIIQISQTININILSDPEFTIENMLDKILKDINFLKENKDIINTIENKINYENNIQEVIKFNMKKTININNWENISFGFSKLSNIKEIDLFYKGQVSLDLIFSKDELDNNEKKNYEIFRNNIK